MFEWRQGEHIAIVGQTGSGKTFLLRRLGQLRGAVIIIRTKIDDITFPGYQTIQSISGIHVTQRRYVLDVANPKLMGRELRNYQAKRIREALERIYHEGRWCVAIDEVFYCYDKLHLGDEIETLLTQGRGKKISVIGGMQRNARVSRFALSEPRHTFAFSLEGRDAKELGYGTTPRMGQLVQQLSGHDFAYFRRPNYVTVGNANRLEEL